MKKMLIALSIFIFTGSIALAQPVAVQKNEAVAPAKLPVIKSFVGKVESVTLADAVKSTKSEIVVIDETGKKLSFLVKATTTIYDSESKTMTLEKINKDDKVKVKYTTTKEGVLEAMSVHILK